MANEVMGAEERMIQVAALTSGKNIPSSRFRVRQHIAPLKRAGVEVREFTPIINKYGNCIGVPRSTFLKCLFSPIYVLWSGFELVARVRGVLGSWKAELTWLEREIFPGCLTLEPFLKRPYLFDVDDSIWLNPPFGRSAMIRIARDAEVVLAGNRYLADWFSAYSKNVRIVPTAIDTERFIPRSLSEDKATRRFVIGWTGKRNSFPFLYGIESFLGRFLKDHDAELWIMANQAPQFQKIPADRVRYFPWSPSSEAAFVRKMDVGIMPLFSNDWCRGKCSFKMLQYMATGLPVVVSPVGMNEEILGMGQIGFPAKNEGDWYTALDDLYKDRSLGHRLGVAGREIAVRYFSRDVVSSRLAEIFHELA
ncbi:MAG: glycosyltransferase family 4 protein [Nitrospiria bacterium]